MSNQFQCPKCQSDHRPLLNILCGHTFCQYCYQIYTKCPLCAAKMSRDFTIENWILIDSGPSRAPKKKTPSLKNDTQASYDVNHTPTSSSHSHTPHNHTPTNTYSPPVGLSVPGNTQPPPPPPLLLDNSSITLPSTILGATADLETNLQLMITEIQLPVNETNISDTHLNNLHVSCESTDPPNTNDTNTNGLNTIDLNTNNSLDVAATESEACGEDTKNAQCIQSLLENRSKLRTKLGQAFVKQTTNRIIDLFLEGITTSPIEYRFTYVVKSDDYYLNTCVHRIASEIKYLLNDLDVEVILDGHTQTNSKGSYENNISIILPTHKLG